MALITDSAALANFCDSLKSATFITVDTEFMRETTYWAKLCLVQVSGPDYAHCIDPLAPNLDLSPLYELLANPKVMKVFHAGRQDLEIFYTATGAVPTPVFDTQIAAMVCGFGDQVGYETLVSKLTGSRLDKTQRFTDWSRRPLTNRQVEYALGDVTHLRTVYTKLVKKLEQTGRAAWLDEENAILSSPDTYKICPREVWRRIRARTREPRLLAVLRELAEWRELKAQSLDIPRQRVAKDDALLELAASLPKTVEDIKRSRIAKALASGKYADGVLEAISRVKEMPKSEYPRTEGDYNQGNQAPKSLVELLKLLLKTKAETHNVAQKIIASKDDIDAIAQSDLADVPALHGWRRELFGDDALKLKHGIIAIGLSADGKSIEVFER
ncbi:MAG: ribonuclease D [Candidatus Marinimicrobia bacterium]|nr:ribonuclease D [Candidatus Neomarinimicrobiota bacterium]